MNQDLKELIETYGTKDHSAVSALLDGKSRPTLTSMLVDLTTQYFNDKNSSTLREFLVVTLSGFEPLTGKLGYNGYRHIGISNDKSLSEDQIPKEYCEVKPKNVIKDTGKKLDGGGNFTDYSWQKFQKHKDEDPTMLIGGFIDGKIIHVFSFKYNSKDFIDRIEHQLEAQFPKGDETGKYLRSASFTLNAYSQSNDLDVKVFVNKDELETYKKQLTSGVYELLKKNV